MEPTKGPRLCSVSFFLKTSFYTSFSTNLLKSWSSSHGGIEEGVITSHIQVVNPLLEIYLMDHMIAKAYTEVLLFIQPTNRSSIQYAVGLRKRTLCCPEVYYEYIIKFKILEDLPSSIMPSFTHFGAIINMLIYRSDIWSHDLDGAQMATQSVHTSNIYWSP